MSKKISCLKESPCYNCGMLKECNKKIARNPAFKEIIDYVMPKYGFNYRECGLWISLQRETNNE